MLKSLEVLGVVTTVRQELAIVITGLEEALYDTDSDDPENLETHAFGATGILKTNLARLKELESALGNDFPLERDAEGVA